MNRSPSKRWTSNRWAPWLRLAFAVFCAAHATIAVAQEDAAEAPSNGSPPWSLQPHRVLLLLDAQDARFAAEADLWESEAAAWAEAASGGMWRLTVRRTALPASVFVDETLRQRLHADRIAAKLVAQKGDSSRDDQVFLARWQIGTGGPRVLLKFGDAATSGWREARAGVVADVASLGAELQRLMMATWAPLARLERVAGNLVELRLKGSRLAWPAGEATWTDPALAFRLAILRQESPAEVVEPGAALLPDRYSDRKLFCQLASTDVSPAPAYHPQQLRLAIGERLRAGRILVTAHPLTAAATAPKPATADAEDAARADEAADPAKRSLGEKDAMAADSALVEDAEKAPAGGEPAAALQEDAPQDGTKTQAKSASAVPAPLAAPVGSAPPLAGVEVWTGPWPRGPFFRAGTLDERGQALIECDAAKLQRVQLRRGALVLGEAPATPGGLPVQIVGAADAALADIGDELQGIVREAQSGGEVLMVMALGGVRDPSKATALLAAAGAGASSANLPQRLAALKVKADNLAEPGRTVCVKQIDALSAALAKPLQPPALELPLPTGAAATLAAPPTAAEAPKAGKAPGLPFGLPSINLPNFFGGKKPAGDGGPGNGAAPPEGPPLPKDFALPEGMQLEGPPPDAAGSGEGLPPPPVPVPGQSEPPAP